MKNLLIYKSNIFTYRIIEKGVPIILSTSIKNYVRTVAKLIDDVHFIRYGSSYK